MTKSKDVPINEALQVRVGLVEPVEMLVALFGEATSVQRHQTDGLRSAANDKWCIGDHSKLGECST
jgi:hypothetical protein